MVFGVGIPSRRIERMNVVEFADRRGFRTTALGTSIGLNAFLGQGGLLGHLAVVPGVTLGRDCFAGLHGFAASLANLVINTGLPFILIPFVISGLLKIVQGSGTVAVVTAATLCAPIASKLGLNPILIFLASGAGARSCCHVNDSFFWVYTNCMGFDMKTGLRTLSISNVAMALGGLFATYIASLVL